MPRIRFALSAAAALLAACPPLLLAQGTPPSSASPATAATAPAPAARAITPGARAAAEQLLHLMNVEQVLRSSTESAFDAQVKAQPLMAPFRATMQTWADRYLTWEQFGPKMTQIYAEEFTEPELRQLIAFYQTPIGRKTASLSPVLTRRGAQVGAEVAEEHMAELEQMIKARAAELQQQGTFPSPSSPTAPAAQSPKKP